MKAKIVDKADAYLERSLLDREAAGLLRELTPEKAVEIDLEDVSDRTIRRSFKRAAESLGLAIRVRTRENKVYILLRVND